VSPGDVLVADEEGVVVVPRGRAAEILAAARTKALADAEESLDDWEAKHRTRIEAILKAKGYTA
jgi:regulator of RNase E activity RraA